MGTWVSGLHERAANLHSQIATFLIAQSQTGQDLSGIIAQYQRKLADEYAENFPLALLLDDSDFVVHAEGPGVRHHATETATVGKLCELVAKRLKQLGVAALKLPESAKTAADDLQILLNGMAPGSLYMGFSVASESQGSGQMVGMPDDNDSLASVRSAIRLLPEVPQFIGNESVSEGIAEVIADPDLRDAALVATFHLSPTGQSGIHTLEISAPNSDSKSAILSNRERVVLRDTTMKNPMLKRKVAGEFIGEMREVDIDSGRFQVRNIPEVGTLRCKLVGLSAETGRAFLGRGVRVSGDYEAGSDGKPRFMAVTAITEYARQGKLLD